MNLDRVSAIAREAGRAILEVYHSNDFQVERKGDDSPLTIADMRSHEIIVNGLESLFPGIPVLSEESEQPPLEIRSRWTRYWLVDPLDGTKEFIKRNGEFTVNIGLIEQARPIAGVIFAPTLDALYYAEKGEGAFKSEGGNPPSRIGVDPGEGGGIIAVCSRSHTGAEDEAFLGRFPIKDTIKAGSSLKFCMVAEGRAHIYYRHRPTMEWDTAAGHAIAACAGARVYHLDYGKSDLRNGSFVVSSFALGESEKRFDV